MTPVMPPKSRLCAAKGGPSNATLALAALAAAAAAALGAFLRVRRRRTRAPAHAAGAAAGAAALVRAWVACDPDARTRAAAEAWGVADEAEVFARLGGGLLRFGTAGLRAARGPGWDRMNVVVVVCAARGLLAWGRERPGGLSGGVVVGYDARLMARDFAVAVAAVFADAAVPVRLFERPVPTPFVAFAVREYGCAIGMCVTASHNPKEDSGFKVYGRDGTLLRPDAAAGVERAMRSAPKPTRDFSSAVPSSVLIPTQVVSRAYVTAVASKLQWRSPEQNSASAPVVYTACHGVGYESLCAVFDAFSLPRPIPVVEQVEPDPDFPTLPFPNPEEKGAMDLAMATAREKGARVILANDPDADRLGAAELDLETGNARIFTGDEIAMLLADFLIMQHQNGDDEGAEFAMVASTVSSKVLKSMASKRGFEFREALTGFKWLSYEAQKLEAEGKTVLLSYEEAIGYNVTRGIVADKDGLSAAAVFAEMAAHHYDSGTMLVERLRLLLVECGSHLSNNGYLKLSAKSPSVASIFDDARRRGFPDSLGQATVAHVRDLTNGTDTAEADGIARLPSDKSSQFLSFTCRTPSSENENDYPLVIHLRGSGTEPKVKFYAELRCGSQAESDGSGRVLLDKAVDDVIEKVLQPSVHSLLKS